MEDQREQKKLINDPTLNTVSQARINDSKCSMKKYCFNLSTNNSKTRPLTTATANKNRDRNNNNNYKKRYPIVIFEWHPKMVAIHLINYLAILLVLLACIEKIKPTYCQQLDASQNFDVLFTRNKRWTPQTASDEVGSSQQQQSLHQSRSSQQTNIPAANPNFEAAFQGECGKHNNSNPCEHICLDLHDGTYECSCFYGFTLAVDGYSCASIAVGQQQQQSPRAVAASNRAAYSVPAALSTPTGASGAVRATINTDRSPAANNSVLGSESPAAGPSGSSPRLTEKSTGNNFDFANQQKSVSASTDVVGSPESTLSLFYRPQATDSGSSNGNGRNSNKNQPALILNEANSRAHLPPKREVANDNRKFAANDENEFARGATKFATASKRNEIEGKAESSRFDGDGGGGGGKSRSDEEAASLASNYGGRQSASEGDPTKPDTQSRLLEADGKREAEVTVAEASDYVDGLSAAAFRDLAQWQTTTAGRGSLRLRTVAGGSRYNKLMRHHHHHHHHQGERPNSAALQPRSPQMTATNTSNDNNNKEEFSPSSKNKGPAGDKLVSYDVETTAAAAPSVSLGMGASSNGEMAAPNELNISYEDADPDIRSIMMSNDKLVSQLASSVSSVAAEAPPPPQTTNKIAGNENQQLNSKRQGDGTIAIADEDDLDRVEDYDQSSSAAEAAAKEAKTFGLLDSLVRRTIDEDYATQDSSFWSRRLEISQQQAQRWPMVKAEMGMATTNGINEPFLAKPNRSSGHQDASNDVDSGIGCIPDKGGVGSGRSRSRRSRINTDQLQMQRQITGGSTVGYGSSSGASFDSMNMVRLPSNQIDDNNRLCSDTDKPLEVYRDCSELPECESGGQCIVENLWIPNKKSDSIQMESRARCRCPIGRGGQLCQKHKNNNNLTSIAITYSIIAIQRSTPEFMGHSYLALPMITETSLRNLRLVFRPNFDLSNNRESTLLVYSQKFILLLDDLNRVELRYLTTTFYGGGEGDNDKNNYEYRKDFSEVTRVIGSRDAELGKWNELIVTDTSSSDSQTNFVAGLNRIVLVTPDKIELVDSNAPIGISQNISAEFFVAGLPDAFRNKEDTGPQQLSRQSALGERLLGGFIGCISEFSLNQRVYNFKSDLNGDTLDGFDIGECCNPRESHH